MAVALDNDLTTMSFPIFKKEVTPDGDLMVYGRVTDATVDSDDQIVDGDWSAKALESWLDTGGNVRVQHQAMRDPAGVGLHLDYNKDDGGHWLQAEIVEPVAKRLVEKGVLRAFSVGIFRPHILTSNKASRGIIKGGDIGEVSLVDRPANKNCMFNIVKSASDGLPEYIGKMYGEEDFIGKALTPSPADVARIVAKAQPQQGEIPTTMYASPVANRLQDAITEDMFLEKVIAAEEMALKMAEPDIEKKHREFSMSERRLHAKEGNALPDGSYPIPDKDALRRAAILARSGHGNVSGARALIARRAREMGVSNPLDDDDKVKKDALVPEGTVTTDAGAADTEKGDMCATCKGKGTIRGGSVKCPDCTGKAMKKPMDDCDDDEDEGGHGDTSKAAKKPPFMNNDDDDDDDKDSSAKAVKKPKAGKGDDVDLGAAHKPIAGEHSEPAPPSVIDTNITDGHATGPGGRNYLGNKVKKSRFCSSCGCAAYKGAAFCSGCGAEFAGKAKAKKPPTGSDPAAGVKAKPGTQSVPSGPVDDRDDELGAMGWPGGEHPSPEGHAVMDSSGTGAVGSGNSTSMGRKSTPAPYSLARAHDAFCAAYSAETVLGEYPSLKSVRDAIDLEGLRVEAGTALISKDYELSEALLGIARSGEDVVKAEQEVIDDARAALHKSFTDMYPSAHPTPGSISPGMFNRPYISAGHASMSAEPPGPQPPASEPPAAKPASSFNRGALTAGHERPSPGNKADDARPAVGPGMHSMTPKLNAQVAMQRIHDHIGGIYPDLCPMNNANTAMPRAVGLKDDGTQLGVTVDGVSLNKESLLKAIADRLLTADEVHAALGEGNVSPDRPSRKGRKKATLVKAYAGNEGDGDVTAKLESFQTEVLGKVQALIDNYTGANERFDQMASQLGEQKAMIDQLGAQPDPQAAPNRGIVTTSPASGGASLVERRSLVDEAAAKARDEKMMFLRSLASSGDPVMREQAEHQITKMLSA